MIRTEFGSNQIARIIFERTDKPMNVVDDAFLDALEKNFQDTLAKPGLRGIIFTSSKPEFIAGADLSLFAKFKSFEDVHQLVWRMHSIYRAIEKAPVPVVAAINGTALGGGFELCLACHGRIALDLPKLQIGLPEVLLGLMPGAGGTQRLPRLIGFAKAIPLLTQGTKLAPAAAKEQGLVDAIVKDIAELLPAAERWILESGKKAQAWDEPKFKLPAGDVQTPKGYQFFAGANAMATEKTQGNYPAPHAILRAVYEGLLLPFDTALALEAKIFADLALTKEAKHMIRTLFFAANACAKGAGRPEGEPKTQVKKVAVLGAGMMGAGIAHVSAKSGMEVVLKDVKPEAAEAGKKHAENLSAKEVEKGRLTAAKRDAMLALIHPTTDPADVKGSDLVVEAVIEDREIKAKVTRESEAATATNCIFASNTSTLPITGLAERSSRPENFVGIHFFSPVEKMQLVEIIKGEKTSPRALAVAVDYVLALKKTPIVVNDGRGFYTSRVFTKYIEEGVLCLVDGIAPALIENAGKMAGMPVGPLSVADEVSLDLIFHILSQTKRDLGDDSVNADLDQVIRDFVEKKKRLGRKSGGGFYEYPANGKKHLWPELTKIFRAQPDNNDVNEVKTRLLYAQALETIRCMEEGVLTSARDADVGSIFGWGFPAYTGGTISFVDYVGVERFHQEALRLEKTWGPRFRPPTLLTERAKKKLAFHA